MNKNKCCCCCNTFSIQDYINQRIAAIQLLGTQAQLIDSPSIVILDGETIPFNDLIVNQNPNVTFDGTTGVFTVTKAGNYSVHYFVNINGSSGGVTPTLSVNGINVTSESTVQGQMSGFATLTLNAGDTISLVNASGFDISLGGDAIQAGIQIISI